MGNGRQNHKFSSPKNRGGILLYCAGADGNTCGRKSSGDEKQLIDLEWPYNNIIILRQSDTIVVIGILDSPDGTTSFNIYI